MNHASYNNFSKFKSAGQRCIAIEHTNSRQNNRLWSLFIAFAAALALVLWANVAFVQANSPEATLGATYLVDSQSGTDAQGCGVEAMPCRSIQFAVNQAVSGDTILVAGAQNGRVYVHQPEHDRCLNAIGVTGVVCFWMKELTILGGYAPGNWSIRDPEQYLTIIDGENRVQGVFATADDGIGGLRLEGFTIRNGYNNGNPRESGVDRVFAFGGGLFANTMPYLIVKDVVFQDNRAIGMNVSGGIGGDGSGGGVGLRFIADAQFENVTFVGNLAQGGNGGQRGGYGIGGGIHTFHSTITGTNLTFHQNRAVGGNSQGPGIAGGELADGLGGGAAVQVQSHAIFNNVIFTENRAIGGDVPNGLSGGGYGGGFFGELATANITNGYFYDNVAIGGDGQNQDPNNSRAGLAGGGAYVADSTPTVLDRVQIINNRARGGGGASFRGGVIGGGISLVELRGHNSTARITNSIIAHNVAEMGSGSDPRRGGGGGAIWVHGVNTDIIHSTIVANRVAPDFLQAQAIIAIDLANGTQITTNIEYSILSNHNMQNSTVVTAQSNNTVNFRQNLFAANSQIAHTNPLVAGYSTGTINGLNSGVTAPAAGFVSPGAPNHDYRLQVTSPALDQATGSTKTIDIAGNSRPEGAAPDLGAHEVSMSDRETDPITLTVLPTSSETALLMWTADTSQLSGLQGFRIMILSRSRSETTHTIMLPNSEIEVGASVRRYVVTGLTNGRQYDFTIQALGANDQVLAVSPTVGTLVSAHHTLIPSVVRR